MYGSYSSSCACFAIVGGGLLRVKAFSAACCAKDCPPGPLGTGGAALFTAGGGGGGDNGSDGEELTFKELEIFRDDGGGIGGFLPNGGGFGLLIESVLGLVNDERPTVFLNCDTDGAIGATPGRGGGAFPGTFGGTGAVDAEFMGGLGADLSCSGSDKYEGFSAPVFTAPPVFRNFGIPPANMPANCGAAVANDPPSCPASLLLLPRCPIGGGGARPFGEGLFIPGTGGALDIGALGPPEDLETMGADRSLTTPTFLSRAPPSILLKRAPYKKDMLVLRCCLSGSRL